MSATPGIVNDAIRRAMGLPALPYPGLRPFHSDESPVFFGRERMVDDVIDRIGESRLVTVHGASGTGKSSLIRAGVIAQLGREHSRRGLECLSAVATPGGSPMWHLATALVGAVSRTPQPDPALTARVRSRMARTVFGLAESVANLGLGEDQRVLILIDQFEEIFRFAAEGGMSEAMAFVRLLVDLHEHPVDGLYVVLTMRSDHLGDCAGFQGLAEVVNSTHYLVPPMNDAELQDAICRPAEHYNGRIDPQLAQTLIQDTRHNSDQLPLIQHALAYLWELAPAPEGRRNIGLTEYWDKRVGSATDALSNHADAALATLENAGGDALYATESVFRALTQIDSTGRAIRRRRTRTELLDETGVTEELLDLVLLVFKAKQRSFIVVEESDPEREAKIDISHEALIRHWTKLNKRSLDQDGRPRGWVAREGHDGRLWQGLVSTVETAANPVETYLAEAVYKDRRAWWDSRRPTATWAKKYGNRFDEVQRLMERSRLRINEDAKRAQDTERTKERNRSLSKRIAILSVAAVVGLLALTGYLAVQRVELQRQEARTSSALVDARKAAADAQAAKKGAEVDKATAQSALRVAIRALEKQWEFTIGMLADGDRIPGKVAMPSVQIALEFLRDEGAASDIDRRNWPRIKDVEDFLRRELSQPLALSYVLPAHTDEVDGVAYSPDGRRLATGSDDGTVRLWNAADASLLHVLKHPGEVTRVAFSPDSARLVSVSTDDTARVWDVATGKELHVIDHHTDSIWGVAWSSDGQLIATASSDKTVGLWNADDRTVVAKLPGHLDGVFDVAFSPDGAQLVSVSNDGTARVWDTRTHAELRQFGAQEGGLYAVSWASDGGSIATAGASGAVRIWNPSTAVQLAELKHDRGVWTLAFSPDGRYLLVGSDGGSVHLWELATERELHVVRIAQDDVDSVAWSPDGNEILFGSDDSRVRIMTRLGYADIMRRESSDVQGLVTLAKRLVPRCLDEEQRAALSLNKEIPEWCLNPVLRPPFDSLGRLERGKALLREDPPDVETATAMFEIATELAPDRAEMFRQAEVEALKDLGERIIRTRVDTPADIEAGLEQVGALVGRLRRIDPDVGDDALAALRVEFLLAAGAGMLSEDRNHAHAHKAFSQALELDPSVRARVVVMRAEAAEARGDIIEALMLALELEVGSREQRDLLTRLGTATAPTAELSGHSDSVDGIAVSPDGELIATASDDKTARLWNRRTGTLLRVLEGHERRLGRIAFSPTGDRLVTAGYDDEARVWDVASGETLSLLRGHDDAIWGVAWSARNDLLATGSHDGTVRLWSPDGGGPLATLTGHSGTVWDVAFSPDGSKLASAGSDGLAKLWSVAKRSEELSFDGHDSGLCCVAWAPKGGLVASAGNSGIVRLWEPDTGRERARFDNGSRVWGIAFSPDGRSLVVGSTDSKAHVWDIATTSRRRTLDGAKDNVDGVAWLPDGSRVLTASDDSIVRTYDTNWGDSPNRSRYDVALGRIGRCYNAEERMALNLVADKPLWCEQIGGTSPQYPSADSGHLGH